MPQQSYFPPAQPLQVPEKVARLIGISGIGRVLAFYEASGQAAGGVALLLVGGFFALPMLCTGGTLVALFSSTSDSTIALARDRGIQVLAILLILIVLLGVLMAWFGLHLLMRQPKRLYLCEEGLVLDEKQGSEPLRWDHIASVSRYWTRHVKGHEADWSQRRYFFTYYCLLVRKDGQQHTIEESDFPQGQTLGEEIARQVTRRLLPQALAAYHAGQTLCFGDLCVSKQGLSTDPGRSILPWSAISSIRLGGSEGTRDELAIMILWRGKPQRWYFHESMPNAALFREVARVVGVRCEKTLPLHESALSEWIADPFSFERW